MKSLTVKNGLKWFEMIKNIRSLRKCAIEYGLIEVEYMKGTLKQSDSDRKGQAATEFLMTYGWAILAIVIVAAVLWNMGVFRGQCAKTAPVQVFGSGEQIQVSDWALDTGNRLTMSLKNLAGNDISITGGNLYVPQGTLNGTNNTAATLIAGGDIIYTITGAGGGTSGNCFTADVNMTYTVTGGVQDHAIKGTIRGKY